MLEADNKNDFWDELPSIVKTDVKTAINQSVKGKGKSHKEIMKKYEKWSTK